MKRFEQLAEHLRNEKLEGMDENNVHHFHHALTAQLFNLTQLPTELLLEYDQNIVKHTLRLNERRITRGEAPIVWKYFQYLTLLFTEIYLDRYFRDPASAAEGDQRAGRRLQRRQAGERTRSRPSTKTARLGRSSTRSPTGAPPAAARRC